MSQFLDFDPETGISHYFDYNELTGDATIHTVQDVEPLLKYTRALANDGGTDRGIKEGWWLYAKIPSVVQVKLHQMGINISDPNSTKRIIQVINEHFPHLKCTVKNHDGIAPKIFHAK